MSNVRPAGATWTSRRRLAWTLRLSTVVVPLGVAILTMVGAAHLWHRPRHGVLLAAWYVVLLAISYLVSWATGKVMDRTLPLAALLEMSLCFPERAPSRLGLSQRSGSAAELTRLATARPDESTQDAAERILKLLSALSVHDRFTRGHAERVRAYTDLIAEKMGLPAHERERLRWAALLHDIGKLRVPSTLLNKPGKPTETEWDQLKAHPLQGSIIAAPLLDWLRPMDRVIAEHHERFDGTGYPVGLAGEAISPGSRIVTVADCFEAMTAVRSYNRPMKREAALAEIVRCAGTQFDPVVVRALLAVPNRRLVWAMGPTAWLAGLPMVGQGSLGVLRTAVSHGATAALGATALAVAAIAPTSLFDTTAAAASEPATVAVAHAVAPSSPARTSPAADTPAAPSTGTATSTPSPTPAVPVAEPTRAPRKTPAAKPTPTVSTSRTRPTHPPAPTSSRRPESTLPPVAPEPPTTPVPTTTPAPTTTQTTTATRTSPAHTTGPATTPPAVIPVVTSLIGALLPTPTTTHATTAPPTTAAPTTTAPPTTAAPTTTPAGLHCTATYVSTSSTGLKASITVTNTGTALGTGWTVTWAWPTGNPKITSYTNAVVSQSGKAVTSTNGLLNLINLPGAGTVFTISGTGNPVSPVPILTCVQH